MSSRCTLLLCLATVAIASSCTQSDSTGPPRIAIIPKGATHIFWQSVHAGALKASQEFGVEVLWVAPEKEDQRQQQIGVVDNQIINGVAGILLAPLDDVALRRPVESASRKQIPVIIFDSALQDAEEIAISFVATDNFVGGQLAGQQLGEALDGKGKVIMLRYQEGSASTEKREAGFLQAIHTFPEIEVVSDEQYAGVTAASAQQASENLLLRFKDADGNLTIDGVFCPNEPVTYGMLQALRRSRLAGKVRFVGFDASKPLLQGLEQAEIDGLVVQNPFMMGYLAVQAMAKHLEGKPIEKRIDTGVQFVQASNLEDPAIQQLVNPDLAPWLQL